MSTLPKSETWNLVDYSFRATDPDVSETGSRLFSDQDGNIQVFSFIQFPNVVVEDGYTHFVANTSSSNASIKDVSSLILEEEIAGGVPENFTFEFDIFLTEDLPKQASNVNNRLFVGAINLQGYSAGFIFSREGIHLAAYPEDPQPNILAGTKGLLFNDDGSLVDGVFFRAVISGEDGRLYVYAESSTGAYFSEKNITDAELIASVSAKPSQPIYNDSIIIYGSGCSAAKQVEIDPSVDFSEAAGQDVSFSLGSLRLASGKVFPKDRPTAAIAGDAQVVVGHAMVLSGIQSSDIQNRPLIFEWEIEVAPDGSKASLQGAKHAVCTISITNENPGPGDPVSIDIIALAFLAPSGLHNDYKAVLTVGSPGESLSISINNETKQVLILLEADNAGNSATTVASLVAAFSDTMAAGYNIEISGGEDLSTGKTYPRILTATVATTAFTSGYELVQPGEFFFASGSGSDIQRPIFIPDIQGTYAISLRVHNGLRWSAKEVTFIIATLTEQLLGHRPNSKYIFKYLPDFWKMVQDKEQLPAIWSAITQVISSELISTWQNDYAKTLKDIARRYQRRWLHYTCNAEIPEDVNSALIWHVSSEYSTTPDELAVQPILTGTHSKTSYVFGTGGMQPIETGKGIVYSNVGPPEVAEITEVLHVPGEALEAGKWRVTTKLASFPVYKVLGDRTGGYFVTDPEDVVVTTPVTSSVMFDPTYPFSNIDPEKDCIRLKLKNGDTIIANVVEFNPGGVKNTVRLDIPREDVDGIARDWEHLRRAQYNSLRQGPYIEVGSTFSFGDTSFEVGDYAILSIVDPYSTLEVPSNLSVIAVDGNSVFVNWDPLIEALNSAASINGDDKEWTETDLLDVSWKLMSIMKHRETFGKEDLVSIPSVGASTVAPQEQKELYDFSIEDNRIKFYSLISGTADIIEGFRIKINPGFSYHPDLRDLFDSELSEGVSIEDLEKYGINTIVLEDGPAGTYRILGTTEEELSAPEFLVDTYKSGHGAVSATKVKFHVPTYSSNYVGKNIYWAELSYFDNSQTVENNFGLFVGFPKDLIHAYDEELDYLSVIKSMWFAFLSGPHFDNLKLAVQTLFDLPYAETASQVTFIDPPTDTEEGKILLTEVVTNRTYTYEYPLGAELAVNPATGRLIKPFNIVDADEEAALDADQKMQLEDSRVAAYTKLVDVVRIEDYISNPELIESQFGGNVKWYVDDEGVVHEVDEPPTIIEKYHKFIVDVPLDVARSTEVFPLVKTFLTEAKPAYTDFILVGSIKFVDEVSVVEEPILKPTLLLKDTPHTEPFSALYDGVGKIFQTMLPLLNNEGQPVLGETGEQLWSLQNETQNIITSERELLTWPTERTKEKVAGVNNTEIESLAFAHTPVDGFEFFHTHVEMTNPDGSGVFMEDGVTPVLVQQGGPFFLTIHKSHAYGTIYDLPPVAENIFTDLGKQIENAKTIGFYLPGSPKLHLCEISAHWKSWDLGVPQVGDRVGWQLTLILHTVMDDVNVNHFNGYGEPGAVSSFYLFTQEFNELPTPVVTYWEDDDVKEKFESGYCEGVLDDYSGDGSWNKKQLTVDMVNSLNSDLDVVNSRIWVPIAKNPAIDAEFELGEEINILVDGQPVVDCIWNDAPPVLAHYGAGYHPKIPFGVNSPQAEHPNTYMLLGFEAPYQWLEEEHLSGETPNASPDSRMNYGHESRLDVLEAVYDAVVTVAGGNINMISLVGGSSGAAASLVELVTGDEVARRHKEDHSQYFLLETMWQSDKLINYGPKATADIIITKYIPFGGVGVHAFQDASFNMSPDGGVYIENTFFHERFRDTLLVGSPTPPNTERWEVNPNATGALHRQLGHPNVTTYKFAGGTPGVDNRRLQLKNPVEGPVILSFLLAQGDFEDGVADGLDMEAPDAGDDLVLYYSADNGLNWVVLETYTPEEDGDTAGWLKKIVAIDVVGPILFRWEQTSFTAGWSWDNWAIADIKIASPPNPGNPDPARYPEYGQPPESHTNTNITPENARNSIAEVQQHPWDPTKPISEQLVPSFSPGFYSWQHPKTDWVDDTEIDIDGGGAITPASPGPLLTWGYADTGKLLGNPVTLDSFTQQQGAKALQNIHIGYKVRCWKEHHYTHGFTEFFIPPPTLKLIEPSSSAYDIRLGGFYFCDDDPTRTEIPTSDPNSFDGQVGGSFLFFRNSASGAETPITDWVFEMGVWPGRHIVPKGPLNSGQSTWVIGRNPDPNYPTDVGQRSDGHIYELNIPPLPGGEGYYDIIIRNYRPWQMQALGQVNIHMDEVIAEKAYYYSPGGWGGIAWGTDSWGGGSAFPPPEVP